MRYHRRTTAKESLWGAWGIFEESAMAKKIVCAGNLCLDITPVFAKDKAVDAASLFLPGKLIGVGEAEMHAGGAIANTGLGMSYFGSEVTLMGKIGNDHFGTLIMNMIDQFPVNNKIKVSEQCSTSYTIVLAPPGIDRIFVHCPSANDAFGYQDIDFEEVKAADLFHFGYPTIMKQMYENPEELTAIYKKAKESGTKTSLDLAAITETAEAAGADWPGIFKAVLPYVDYLVPSVEELCFLIDRNRYYEWTKRANGRDITEIIDWETDVRPLADRLLDWGAKTVLIKCGIQGMYLRTCADEACGGWSDVELFERSYKADKFCSATGAGDVSIAAFLTAVLEGYSPKRCLQLAAGAGACCVTAYDAISGLIPFEQLIAKIDGGWAKNE